VRHTILGAILVCALAAPACSSSDDSSTSSTTAPTVLPATSENFSGTVQVGGLDAHPFVVALSGGLLNVTLTAVGPPPTIFMGFGVGSWDGTTCTPLAGGSANVQASTTPQLSGTVNAGSYCVMVFDIGNMVAPVTYSWTMTHY